MLTQAKMATYGKDAGASYAIAGKAKHRDCRMAEIGTSLWAARFADPLLDIILNVTQLYCLPVLGPNAALDVYYSILT